MNRLKLLVPKRLRPRFHQLRVAYDLLRGSGAIAETNAGRLRVLGEAFSTRKSNLHHIATLPSDRSLAVEVGSLAGLSTRVWASAFDHVISIDPYIGGYDEQGDSNSRQGRLNLARSLFLIRFFDDPRVTQKNLPSVQAASTFVDGSADLVYIDANHTREAVLADIQAWLPKVRKGGVLAGDDYRWPGVTDALTDSGLSFTTHHDQWIVHV